MLSKKMNSIIEDVCSNLAEREELVHTIALALLTKKNLFVLGKPGQAKSQAIDLFRLHIDDAKQFDVLMSKGIDQEQLFGRLDLSSIIPGHISLSRLKSDPTYQKMKEEMEKLLEDTGNSDQSSELTRLRTCMENRRQCLAEVYGGKPEIITENKIPESDIVFLDEVFKANDGVLNSLLKALNERIFTNEGVTKSIPTISFFAASNEIPNFHNPEEQSLRALYDRFDFKVHTKYVEEKSNRMKILKGKQSVTKGDSSPAINITLEELSRMQNEVRAINVPDSINELADNILCELRRKDIFVSDRTYFNLSPVVQAEAWLNGHITVQPEDMKALVNYLWDKPEDREIIREVIYRLTENPLGDKLNALLAKSYEHQRKFDSATDKNQALITMRNALVDIYDKAQELRKGLSDNDAAHSQIDSMIATLEEISRNVHEKTQFTYLPLDELKAYKTLV